MRGYSHCGTRVYNGYIVFAFFFVRALGRQNEPNIGFTPLNGLTRGYSIFFCPKSSDSAPFANLVQKFAGTKCLGFQ
jgi:hypothetical protein